jgi:hypothetical protein
MIIGIFIQSYLFNCNYGNPEIPSDKWFKTYNDGTEEATNKLLRNDKNPLY